MKFLPKTILLFDFKLPITHHQDVKYAPKPIKFGSLLISIMSQGARAKPIILLPFLNALSYRKRKRPGKNRALSNFNQQYLLLCRSEGLLQLLNWPVAVNVEVKNIELFVCRDVYFCMLSPTDSVPTHFVRVAELDAWLTTNIVGRMSNDF